MKRAASGSRKTRRKEKSVPEAPAGAAAEALLSLMKAVKESQIACVTASERETSEELRALYDQMTEQKASNLAELRDLAGRQGVADPGQVARVVESGEPEEVLASEDPVDSDEEAAHAYERALDLDWPQDLREALERQQSETQEALEHLRELKSMSLRTDTEDTGEDRDLGRDIL